MNIAYLLIGGNLGNRLANLQKAIVLIEQYCGSIAQSSAIYETAAWGLTDQPSFYNQALILHTSLAPKDLMQKLLNIETEMGRKRIIKMGPRIIDLDMIFYNDLIVDTEILKLPHPAIQERKFVLMPIAEISANFVHPVSKKTIAQMLMECKDALDVQKLSVS